MGWGAVCEGRGVNGLWSVTEAASHINVLELRTVVLALRHFLPRLSGQHVLMRTDNTAALAYKSPRRSALPVSTPLGDSPAPVGSEARPFPQGSSYTRSPQLRCGPVIEGRSSSSRLVSTPTSDRPDLGAFFRGPGGPVRKQAEHLLSALVLARGRQSPTRHRRAGAPVASSTPICFSPDPAPPASAVQDSG